MTEQGPEEWICNFHYDSSRVQNWYLLVLTNVCYCGAMNRIGLHTCLVFFACALLNNNQLYNHICVPNGPRTSDTYID